MNYIYIYYYLKLILFKIKKKVYLKLNYYSEYI